MESSSNLKMIKDQIRDECILVKDKKFVVSFVLNLFKCINLHSRKIWHKEQQLSFHRSCKDYYQSIFFVTYY